MKVGIWTQVSTERCRAIDRWCRSAGISRAQALRLALDRLVEACPDCALLLRAPSPVDAQICQPCLSESEALWRATQGAA